MKLLVWPRTVRLGKLKVSLQGRFIARCLAHLGKLPEDTIVYVRHLKLADAILSARPRPRVVFEVHELFSENPDIAFERAKFLQKMEGRVFVGSDGLICITQGLVDALKNRYLKLPPIAIAPDACDPAPFAEIGANGGDKDAVDLIYAGSLHPWKGVETLVQAMAYLPEKRLRIVGGREEEIGRLRLLARRWRVADRCEFTGHLPQREVWRHLRRARIGVAPNIPHAISSEFTSPLKIFEYLAAGKPVLASNLPALHEVLDQSVARFFAPRSPKSLAVAAEKLLADEAAMAQMSDSARRLAINHTWARRADRITKLIAELPRRDS